MGIREDILAAKDCTLSEPIEVPEWGVSVRLRFLTSGEREKWELRSGKNSDVRESLAVYSICDIDGKQIFTEADIPLLKEKNAHVLDRLSYAAVRHNKITREDIEELQKNS